MPGVRIQEEIREQCQHVEGAKVCCHRLSARTTEESFKSYCAHWGDVEDSNIVTHQRQGSRFGFVTFERPESAISFLNEDFHILDDQRVLATAAVSVKHCLFRGIFVYKLGGISNNDLFEYLEEHCGPVSSFSRPCDNQGRMKHFAFVHFANRNSAEKSLLMAHKIGDQAFGVVRLRVDQCPTNPYHKQTNPASMETSSLNPGAPTFNAKEGSKIYIGKLDSGISKNDLSTYCEKWGKVSACSIKERESGARYAFVTFATAEAAQAFLDQSAHSLGGRRIKASAAGVPPRGVCTLGKMIAVQCLRKYTSVDSLQDFFSQFGKVQVAFKRGPFGWVQFASQTSAEKALLAKTRKFIVSRAVHGDVATKVQVWSRAPEKESSQQQPQGIPQPTFMTPDGFAIGWVGAADNGDLHH